MNRGEICLAQFPLAGSGGNKLRPVLFLTGPLGTVPEYLVAYISSVIPPSLVPTDLMLDPSQPDYASTNLKTVSVLRLHKLATIHRRDIARQLGTLSNAIFLQEVEPRLRILLKL